LARFKESKLLSLSLKTKRSAKSLSSPAKCGRKRKLTFREELLLVLMKLRLGLTNHNLANRFGVSDVTVSSIFTTLIKLLSKYLRPLIYYPAKEAVRVNLPRSFAQLYPRIHCILDGTKFFIDWPQNLQVHSDYKKDRRKFTHSC